MPSYSIRRPRTKARIYYDDGLDFDEHNKLTATVHEPDDEPIATGLLDKDGNELMRNPDRRPIGFGHVYEDDA